MNIGMLHPGEMGSVLGALLRERGVPVLWASAGRGDETARRAEEAGLEDAGTVENIASRCQIVLSVCPPEAALGVARLVAGAGFAGIYVDANAISPATAREVAALIEASGGRYVDGGIVGPPPRKAGTTRLYLSGASAAEVELLFADSFLEPRVLSDEPGAASALKMAYAAWTKGSRALLLAVRALARVERIEPALLAEWADSLPGLADESEQAARSAGAKAWRWVAEAEEMASTFGSAGLPTGFFSATAEVFRRSPRLENASLDDVLGTLSD